VVSQGEGVTPNGLRVAYYFDSDRDFVGKFISLDLASHAYFIGLKLTDRKDESHRQEPIRAYRDST
jgi:hypothetical protein